MNVTVHGYNHNLQEQRMTLKRLGHYSLAILLMTALILPFTPTRAEPAEELITMNFEEADIRILIKFISELTQKNFIIDDKIKGKVTIISPEKITVPEAFRVFESILEVKGFTLVPAGKVIKIVLKNEAKQRAIKTDTGKTLPLSEGTDEFITRITRLEYVNADELLTLIRPLFSKEGHVVPYKSTNTLIMTDLKSNLYRILKIINELDVKGYHAELYVLPLQYASVKTVTDHLTNILEQGSVSGPTKRAPARGGRTPSTPGSVSGVSSSAKIISDERTNSLIVLATRNDYETIIKLVQKLDVEAPEGKGRVNIYYLQNAVAEEIVAVLNEFITGIKADQEGAKGGVKLPTETDIKIVADKATNSLIINADPEDYEQIKSLIGKRIKSIRKSRRLTQEQLAEKANLHSKYISSLECGRENPTLEVFLKLSSALKIEMIEIFAFEHEKDSVGELKKDINRLVDQAGLEQLKMGLKLLKNVLT